MNLFALDYDDTYTDDPELWDDFIAKAVGRGHHVMIVTARSADDLLNEPISVPGVGEVVYTGGEKKRAFLENGGLPQPDIWIDDRPEHIV